MKNRLLLKLALGLFVFGLMPNANALIINLNAQTATTASPNSYFFSAGSYDVTRIGVADGGLYNAWNAWRGQVDLPDIGWLNRYNMSSDELGVIAVDSSDRYASDILALNDAISTSFSLLADGYVNFYFSDSVYWDNAGGISLEVTPSDGQPVPEPAMALLLLSGLAGIIGVRIRRNQ